MLTKRLAMCAELVGGRGIVCDIGTDHAYLPVYLVESGKCTNAYACDVADGPLSSARSTVTQSGLADKIRLIKSDGLNSVPPDGISDVVLAGMGGELIMDIIGRADWLKNGVNLVLQPNTRETELIKYLCGNGFDITQKRACEDGRFIYIALGAKYSGNIREISDFDAYVYGLDMADEASCKYIMKQSERIAAAAKGMLSGRNASAHQEAERLEMLAERLKEYASGRKDIF